MFSSGYAVGLRCTRLICRSLRPLFVSLVPGNQRELDKLRLMRESLSNELSEIIGMLRRFLVGSVADDVKTSLVLSFTKTLIG